MAVRGTEHLPLQGPVILAGNHPTVLDGLLVAVFCPRRITFLIKAEVMAIPLIGHFLRRLGAIPVARGGDALQRSVQVLERGACLGIFPEGDPSNQEELIRLRRGVAVLARETGLPVVPFRISGTLALCSLQSFVARSGPVGLAFGEPVYWRDEEFLPQLAQAIRRLPAPDPRPVHRSGAWLLRALVLQPLSLMVLAGAALRFHRRLPGREK